MTKLLYFVGGLTIGAISGGVPTYLYMKKKLDANIDELNGYLSYNDIVHRYNGEDFEDDRDEVNPLNVEDDSLDDVKEKLERNYQETTNYAAMYKGDAANHEHPMDDDEEEADENEDLSDEAVEMTIEHNKNKDKPPKIISESALGDLPSYVEVETLFYYPESDILTTEEDEEISDPETYIGDALTKYGFDHNDEEQIFVRNFSLDMCYDIQKMDGEFKGR